MDIDTIEEGARGVRNQARRIGAVAQSKMEEGRVEAGAMIDRAQRTAADLGDQAYRQGEQVVRRAAEEVGARPWTAAFMVGSVLLAGASYYLLHRTRRH
jgi:ElaB/YqjD/DUF883 family membrane-anchored ribosome-binding protein